jgi:hypothetical protein
MRAGTPASMMVPWPSFSILIAFQIGPPIPLEGIKHFKNLRGPYAI